MPAQVEAAGQQHRQAWGPALAHPSPSTWKAPPSITMPQCCSGVLATCVHACAVAQCGGTGAPRPSKASLEMAGTQAEHSTSAAQASKAAQGRHDKEDAVCKVSRLADMRHSILPSSCCIVFPSNHALASAMAEAAVWLDSFLVPHSSNSQLTATISCLLPAWHHTNCVGRAAEVSLRVLL